ncbi:MAG: hypothetical protein ABIU06_19920 [Anaerolineales bacterium]
MEKITNNKRLAWLAGVFAGLLSIIAVGMGVWMTWLVMGRVLPGNLTARFMALAFFDGGALGWAGVYVYKARGTPQRSISLWLLVWDLLGVVAMVIGEILIGGQELVAVPAWIGKFIIDTVIGTFALNLVAWYYYHTNAPETREAITAQDLEDELTEQAERQARAAIERESQQLGALLAGRVTSRIKYRMRLPMSETEAEQWRGDIVDAEALPSPAQLPAPVSDGVPVWLMGLLHRFFGHGRSQPAASEPTTVTPTSDLNSNDKPEPEPKPSA